MEDIMPATVTLAAPLSETRANPVHAIALADGLRTLTRPAWPEDYGAVQDLHDRCSAETRWNRYLAGRRGLTPRDWAALTHPSRALMLLTTVQGKPDDVVAMTNLVASLEDPAVHDLGLLIVDGLQGRGLGQALTELALHHARHRGAAAVSATTFHGNRAMTAILRSAGAELRQSGPTVDALIALS
jgi:RimJ/RimL family protein N-acetyltransferase